MAGKNRIACVTGASGMVGMRIVERLIQKGFKVRVLTRRGQFVLKGVEIFDGGLEDESVLGAFVSGADHIYHCAAELQDESKMWEVNVKGTQKLLCALKNSAIKYFLYLSSAGVIGITNVKEVNEHTLCNPITMYEKTKWESEKLIFKGIDGCSVVILRPTNIVDKNHLGVLNAVVKNGIISRIGQYLKRGECAHIVHAKDVANAALYFNEIKFDAPECFFVSRDKEPLNSFFGLRAIYTAVLSGQPLNFQKNRLTPPLFIPYILRKLRLGKSNWGDVKYSSRKIEKAGFRFSFDIISAVSDILLSK